MPVQPPPGSLNYGYLNTGTLDAPVSDERARLLRLLPDEVYARGKLKGGRMDRMIEAAALELEQVRGVFALLGLVMFPDTSPEPFLTRWERQLGLPPDDALTVTQRQARAGAKWRARFAERPQGTEMAAAVQALLGHLAPPAIREHHADRYAVFVPAAEGWPGDGAFARAEALLGAMGKASRRFYLAPHDTAHGLTWDQVDRMAWDAVDELTWDQLTGGM